MNIMLQMRGRRGAQRSLRPPTVSHHHHYGQYRHHQFLYPLLSRYATGAVQMVTHLTFLCMSRRIEPFWNYSRWRGRASYTQKAPGHTLIPAFLMARSRA